MDLVLEKVLLNPEQEKHITNEAVKKYIKLALLKQEIQKEQKALSKTLTIEEVAAFSQYFRIPKYLSVREVSKLLGLTMQIVRRHCANQKFRGYQMSGVDGIWHIESEQFFTHPNWVEFISQREAEFENSKKIAELALELLRIEDESELNEGDK